jgi:hypothetical protein
MRTPDFSVDHQRLIDYVQRPRLLHLRAEFLIHERAADRGVTCICCGSTEAAIVERHPGPQVLLDRVTGTRRIRVDGPADRARHEVEAARFDEALELRRSQVEFIYVPIRCTREQFEVFNDRGRRFEMISGGNRAGKTKTAEHWLLWRWLLRGGRRRRLWIVSQELQQAFEVAQRLVYGDDESPPVFPEAVVRSMPTNARVKDPKVVLVDGTVIEIKHTNVATGGNLKGKSVTDILWDEAVETRSRAIFTVLNNRLTGRDGTCLISTTPLPGHFLKQELVDKAERVEVDGTRTGNPLFGVHYLRMRDNVWYPLANIEKSYAASFDDATRRRECDGEWIASEGALWTFWDPKVHQVYGEHRTLAELGRRDVTGVVVKRLFAGDNPLAAGLRPPSRVLYLGGQDFNCNPMTVVVAQVEFDPGDTDDADPADPKFWRLWVWDEVVKKNTNTRAFAEHLKSPELARVIGWTESRYAKMPIICDASGAYTDVGRNRMAPPSKATQRATTSAGVMCEEGFDTRPCRFSERRKPENPRIAARTQLMHRLQREGRIRVHGRCQQLLKSITEQQNRGDGIAEKESHHASDRLSSAIDALCYLCWAIFAETDKKTAGGQVKSFAS